MTIAGWQVKMAARTAPAVASIVERLTPVLSFGDPLCADVATLGINPSRQEFYSAAGDLLTGTKRRLTTTESLGITPGGRLPRTRRARSSRSATTTSCATPTAGSTHSRRCSTPPQAPATTSAAPATSTLSNGPPTPCGEGSPTGLPRRSCSRKACDLETLLTRSNVHLVPLNGATVTTAVSAHRAAGSARRRRSRRARSTRPLLDRRGRWDQLRRPGRRTGSNQASGVPRSFKTLLRLGQGTSGSPWSR